MQKLKVVQILRAPVGGLFRHVLDLSHALIDKGHDVGIFCDSTIGDARSEALLAEIGRRLTLGLVRVPIARNPSIKDFAALKAFQRYLREHRPDIIHGQGSKGGFYARASYFFDPDRARTIRVYTPHGGSVNYKPGSLIHKFYMSIEKALMRHTDLFLLESQYAFNKLAHGLGNPELFTQRTGEAFSLPHARVVWNGVSEAEFDPVDTQQATFDLMYLGELRPIKGVDLLIRALDHLRTQTGMKPSLLIVGAGSEKEAFKELTTALNLNEQITFEDPQPIRSVLARARIMVVPSRNESLPYVILEAAASGHPLIATHVGGIPEIFGPFSDQLIEPNCAEALSNALLQVLTQSEAQRRHNAQKIQEFMRTRFQIDDMTGAILSGYKEALNYKREQASK